MSNLKVKILKDENGEVFIPLSSTLGIDSNGKMLNEEITTILNRITGIDYVPAHIDINASSIETSPSFSEQNCTIVILEFGALTTGESLLNIGDYLLKTNSINTTTFDFELTNGTADYHSSGINKDVILDNYNRLILIFNGNNLLFGINGTSGGFATAMVEGIPYTTLSIPVGANFSLHKLYIAPAIISGLNAVTDSALTMDIDRKVRPYACFLYYRDFISTVLTNEGTGTNTLDWEINQGVWADGYNVIKGIDYPGLAQKPSINGVILTGDKTTEDLLIDASGGSWGEIEGTLSDQTDLQTALDAKVDEVTGKGLSTEDYTTEEKTKLSGIEESANNYSLPTASNTVLGGVKVGDRLTISNGVLSADTQLGGQWGQITGTLSSQTDLQSALDTKVNLAGGTMTGNLTVQGAYIYQTGNGITNQIGSQNGSYCHYTTSAASHWFNKPVAIAGTVLKGASYNVNVPGVFVGGSTPTATQTGDIWFS